MEKYRKYRVLGKYTDPTDHRPHTQTIYFLKLGKYTDLSFLYFLTFLIADKHRSFPNCQISGFGHF